MMSMSGKMQINNKDVILDYNKIYSGPGIRTNSAYYTWLVRLFNFKKQGRLLDVSCGEGIFLREVRKYSKLLNIFGLDISDKAISIARKKSLSPNLVVADGQGIPFKDKSFDYITCLGSLEHYIDQELGVREMLRVAKDDASFYILLPNSLSINLFLHVMRNGDKSVEDFQIIERTATRNEWSSFLDKNGLKVKTVYGSNLWPEFFQEGTLKVKSIPKYIERFLVKCFCPLNLSMDFIFVCKKHQ
ncbi:MAG: hypothetical protein COV73_00430 [Candidatus Omnitrophica bacterium CG11_big_fil_rev_8_21_14_0_20_43_6]|nr:MAG: hypothetical protein COV73_00430 [Candidatus Omnitrophica bacterium CG11_big_fil_rev_8_21_14_0_20_43_6]